MTIGHYNDPEGFVYSTQRSIDVQRVFGEKGFSVAYRDDEFLSGNVIEILLDNPSDSTIMGINNNIIDSTVETIVDIYKDVNITSYGDSLKVSNRRIGSSIESKIDVYTNGTYDESGLSSLYSSVAGSTKAKVGGEMQSTDRIIEPEHNLLIVLENTSNSSGIISVNGEWWEAQEDKLIPKE